MARIKKPTKKNPESARPAQVRLYTLEVFIIGGPTPTSDQSKSVGR